MQNLPEVARAKVRGNDLQPPLCGQPRIAGTRQGRQMGTGRQSNGSNERSTTIDEPSVRRQMRWSTRQCAPEPAPPAADPLPDPPPVPPPEPLPLADGAGSADWDGGGLDGCPGPTDGPPADPAPPAAPPPATPPEPDAPPAPPGLADAPPPAPVPPAPLPAAPPAPGVPAPAAPPAAPAPRPPPGSPAAPGAPPTAPAPTGPPGAPCALASTGAGTATTPPGCPGAGDTPGLGSFTGATSPPLAVAAPDAPAPRPPPCSDRAPGRAWALAPPEAFTLGPATAEACPTGCSPDPTSMHPATLSPASASTAVRTATERSTADRCAPRAARTPPRPAGPATVARVPRTRAAAETRSRGGRTRPATTRAAAPRPLERPLAPVGTICRRLSRTPHPGRTEPRPLAVPNARPAAGTRPAAHRIEPTGRSITWHALTAPPTMSPWT